MIGFHSYIPGKGDRLILSIHSFNMLCLLIFMIPRFRRTVLKSKGQGLYGFLSSFCLGRAAGAAGAFGRESLWKKN